jgi:uncharacterized protein (DUF1778 family)
VTYLDNETKHLVDAAIKATGENASMFTAKALTERAKQVLNKPEHK